MGKRANLLTETWLDEGKRQRAISLVSNPKIEVTCSHAAFRAISKKAQAGDKVDFSRNRW